MDSNERHALKQYLEIEKKKFNHILSLAKIRVSPSKAFLNQLKPEQKELMKL
jgi:hypothetical protein